MQDNSTWAETLKAYINDCIDRLYRFFATDDDGDYVGAAPNNGRIDIEIRLSIKARKS